MAGGTQMHRILTTPAGSPERQAALDAARIPAGVQGMLLADDPARERGRRSPSRRATPTTTLRGDPAGVVRVDVESLPQPLQDQLLASQAVQTNTGASAGVSFATRGDTTYVAVNASNQLVDVQGGQATVFQTRSTNVLSVFAEADMTNPAEVRDAYATSLSLTQGGQRTQPLPTEAPLTAEQVSAYQDLGYTVAVLDPSNGNAAVRPPARRAGRTSRTSAASPAAIPSTCWWAARRSPPSATSRRRSWWTSATGSPRCRRSRGRTTSTRW